MSGQIFGIGVGPGDPQLLTLRAAELLSEASLVVAPRSGRDAGSVALEIVAAHLSPDCEVVEAVFPMSEDPAEKSAAAAATAEMLADAARAGRSCAFVTLGDAMLYSTWGYVLRELRRSHADVAVETVPGVMSFSACAAKLGEPLAEGRDALLIWPDALPGDLAPLLAAAPNVVAMKAGRHLASLVDAAVEAGARVSAVQRCGMERERVERDAAGLLGGPVEYFTTAIVHKEAGDE